MELRSWDAAPNSAVVVAVPVAGVVVLYVLETGSFWAALIFYPHSQSLASLQPSLDFFFHSWN